MPKGQLTREKRLEQLATRLKNINKRYKATIAQLQKLIKEQEQRIKDLEERIQDKEAQRKQLLSYLYKENKPKGTKKRLGKKPGSRAFHRPKPKEEEVTETHQFPLTKCPTCEKPLDKPAEVNIRYEEDIDLAPRKIIKKFILPRYWCSSCQDFVKSPHIPPIAHIGPNVLGYILYARYRLRMPLQKIRESLNDLHNFSLSEGETAEKLQETEQLFGKDYQAIIELVKTAKVVYSDETGWRMEGQNWWLWVFATPKGIRYVLSESRGKGIPEEVLGQRNKDRIIVSDGYKVYDKLPGEKQQCWVHLLRVAKQASQLLHQDLVRLYLLLGDELTKSLKQRDPPFFQRKLQDIIQKNYSGNQAKKVQERIKRHQEQLLTCLNYDDVLPENNTAERALRNHVVMRKIFGGSRSIDGARAHEVNVSVIETMLQQNPNSSFFQVMLPLIQKRREELWDERRGFTQNCE